MLSTQSFFAHTESPPDMTELSPRGLITVSNFMEFTREYQLALFKLPDIRSFITLMQTSLDLFSEENNAFRKKIDDLFKSLLLEEQVNFLLLLNKSIDNSSLDITNRFIQWPLLSELIEETKQSLPYATRNHIESNLNKPGPKKNFLHRLFGNLVAEASNRFALHLQILRFINPDQEMNFYQALHFHAETLAQYYQRTLLNNLRDDQANEEKQTKLQETLNTLHAACSLEEEFHVLMIVIGEAFHRHPYIKLDLIQFNRFMKSLQNALQFEEYQHYHKTITENNLNLETRVNLRLNMARELIFGLYDRCVITPHYVDFFLNSRTDQEFTFFEKLSEEEQSHFWDEIKDHLFNDRLNTDKIEYLYLLINHITHHAPDFTQALAGCFIESLKKFHQTEIIQNREHILLYNFLETHSHSQSNLLTFMAP